MRLLVLGLLVGCEEAKTPLNPASMSSQSGLYDLEFTPGRSPFLSSEDASLQVAVFDAAGAADVSLQLSLWMPDHGHGISGEPSVESTATGVFQLGWTFSMPGYWEFTFDIDGPDGADTAVAAWDVQ